MAKTLTYIFAMIICCTLISGSFGGTCSIDLHKDQNCDVNSQFSCIISCVSSGYSNLINSVCKFESDHVKTYCTCNYNC
ncbi:hypothetical protein ABFS82_04G141600 [Erythranthe guttata]